MRAMLFLMFTSLGAVLAAAAPAVGHERFAVYYSDRAPIERLSKYQLLVLDSRYHPPLRALKESGSLLLGYVSLGEADKTNPYFAMLKKQGAILQENKNWSGSYFIDVRNKQWQKTVIEDIIPSVLRAGFDGVFFDTLDSPLELERSDPSHYAGMRDASVHLIEAVRMHYPSIKIMVNRAYAILPRIAPSINMVLGESMLGEYDFEKKAYVRVAQPLYMQQVQWLREAKQHNPALKIYTLDYADTHNRKAISDLYRIQRAHGFIPYVASVGLDKLVDEPGAS